MKPDREEFEHDLNHAFVLRKRRSERGDALLTEESPRFPSRWAHATSTIDCVEYAYDVYGRAGSTSTDLRSASRGQASKGYQRRKTDRAQMGTVSWTTDAASGVWGRLRRVVMSVVGLPC